MFMRALAASTLCLALSTAAVAVPQESGDAAAQADERAAKIGDAQAFLMEVNDAQTMALAGQYGAIKAKDVDRLKAAVATINRLLMGKEQATDLNPDQRIELYNAQQEMVAILRNDDKNRIVCERVKITGSRVSKRECMTVAEREERTRAARESTERHQRVDCIPGETSSCLSPNSLTRPGG
jgi:hypothetical protein